MKNIENTIAESTINIFPPSKPVVTLDNGHCKTNLPELVYMDMYTQVITDFNKEAHAENEFCKMTANYADNIVTFNITCTHDNDPSKVSSTCHVLNFETFEIYALVVSNKLQYLKAVEREDFAYELPTTFSVLVQVSVENVKHISFNDGAIWEHVDEKEFVSAYRKFLAGTITEYQVLKELLIKFFLSEDKESIALEFYDTNDDGAMVYTNLHLVLKSHLDSYITHSLEGNLK